MKITLTWKTSVQCAPYDCEVFTKVVHCEETETLKQLNERITKEWKTKNFDGEIHFFDEDELKKLEGD